MSPDSGHPLPARLGRYEVIGRLAMGGMCEVLLGQTTGPRGFRRAVAIKRLRPGLEGDPALQRLLIQEARIGSSLDHPNIVQVLELDMVEGLGGPVPILVMERVRGGDLARLQQLLRLRERRLPTGLALFCGLRLLRALAAAHGSRDRQGLPLRLVHADVSPHNVLVSVEGQVKLADFGVARLLAMPGEVAERGGGKRAWMSPEQLAGQEIGPESDVYSAGVVLWELLAGQRLFPAEWSGPRPEQFPPLPDGSPGQAELLAAMLALSPADRPSAAEAERRVKALAIEEGHREGPPELGILVREIFPEAADPRAEAVDLAALAVDLAGPPPRVIRPPGRSAPAPQTGLPALRELSPGQVKPVAVLVAEVRGLTDPADPLDAERVARMHVRLLRLVRRIVDEHGGWLDRFHDGIFWAFFGLPRTGEHDLERALATALRLRDDGALDEPLALAIGVHQGELAIGRLDEARPRRLRYLAQGDSTRLALRLSQAAAPHQVLVSGRVRELGRDRFEFRAGPAMAPRRGGGESTRAWVLVGGEQGVGRASGSWVTRGEEREVLARAMRRVAAGEAVRMAVTGPSGSGKSRLLRELGELARHRGVELIAGRASRWGNAEPLAAVQRLLSGLGLAGAGGGLGELVSAARRALRERAASRAPILAFEDADHLSPIELQFLAGLLSGTGDLPLLIILTCRGAPPEALAPYDERIELGPLSPEAQEEMLAQALDAQAIEPGLCLFMERAAEANPRQLVALARAMRQAGGITVRDGLARIVSRTDLGAQIWDLEVLLAARLDALGPEERGSLEVAAVLGQRPSLPLLAELTGQRLGEELVQPLIDAGMLSLESDGLRFVSEPVHELVLRSLGVARRRELHSRVAEAMRARLGEDGPHLAELALHLSRGGRALEAARYAHRAGERLAEQGEPQSALRIWLRAVGWLERASRAGEDPQACLRGEAQLYACLGEVAVETGRREAAQRFLRAGFDAAADLEEVETQARCMIALGRLYRRESGSEELVRAHAEAALEALRERRGEVAAALRAQAEALRG